MVGQAVRDVAERVLLPRPPLTTTRPASRCSANSTIASAGRPSSSSAVSLRALTPAASHAAAAAASVRSAVGVAGRLHVRDDQLTVVGDRDGGRHLGSAGAARRSVGAVHDALVRHVASSERARRYHRGVTDRVVNFSAGPATLPTAVLEEARRELVSLPGVGVSPLEISHRSAWFEGVIGEAEANIRDLLAVPDGYRVLFLQGGASMQFAMVPMNLGSRRIRGDRVVGREGPRRGRAARIRGRAMGRSRRGLRPGAAGGSARGRRRRRIPAHHGERDDRGRRVAGRRRAGGARPRLRHLERLPVPAGDVARYGLLYAGAQKNAGPPG